MIKKILSLLLVGSLLLGLAGCTEDPDDVTIEIDIDEVTLIEGETYQFSAQTNDEDGLIYSVSAAGIISLSSEGLVTANNEGTVTVTIKSKTDSNVSKEVTVNVRKEISLISNVLEVILTEQDTHQLVITSNDGVQYDVANNDIIVIDETGLVTAKEEGTTTVTVSSTYDETKSVEITIIVEKLVTITVNKDDYSMVVGDSETIDVDSNEGLDFVSSDPSILTVSETGELTAISFGTTTVRITSSYDSNVQEIVNVQVYKYTEAIEIDGMSQFITGIVSQLTILPTPVGAFTDVNWESSDESILTIDEDGYVTALKAGQASIIAKSVLDDTIADTFNIEVKDVQVVDLTKQSGDTYTYEGIELEFGINLFSTIQGAVDASNVNSVIFVEAGTYTEDVEIDVEGIVLIGLNNPVLEGEITLSANNISISEINFSGTSLIMNSKAIADFKFFSNTVDINEATSNATFIKLDNVTNVDIYDNAFDLIATNAIEITNFTSGSILINNNTIDTTATAIKLDAVTEYDLTTEIKIMFNTINSSSTAFDVDMMYGTEQKEIFAIARFNKVTNYTKAAISNTGSMFDFTLNYWGKEPVVSDFTNVTEMYFDGYYLTSEEVLTAATYNPLLPIIIRVTNPIEEIIIGETHTFEYMILPFELSDAKVKFITGNPDILAVNQEGLITPLSSGEAYIQVRSAQVSSIRTQTDFDIITTPGIEILTDRSTNNLFVGETMNLEYLLFPYTIESETATFSSSDSSIATITSDGVVSAVAEGLVTFTATLDSDTSVTQDYTVYVYSALDLNNPLDYLSSLQVSYSEIHKWVAYGFAYNYNDVRAESVSRYYFDNIEINQTKMVPVYWAVRPGEPMDPLPVGVTQYNPENIHWVVIHDTASTGTGSGALAHANYLWNNVANQEDRVASWHYTIDDHAVYQHLPEEERGYHAGDGSTNPGEGSYEGGGNRNGIGIEMSVNDDGDMMRTWQRTAKLVVDILTRHNMPRSQMKYHNDFSGKDCPNTLRNAGLIPLFEEFVDAEFHMKTTFPNAQITFTSNNPDYLDNHGRVIQIPERAVTVSYTITVTDNGVTESRTFYTYIPGTVR